MQRGWGEGVFYRNRRAARHQVFLTEMDRVVPRSGLENLISPRRVAFGRGLSPIRRDQCCGCI